VHYAHLAIAEDVYHQLKLDRIVFVPAGEPPHKLHQQVTPAGQRLALLKLAIASNPHFTFSLVDMQRTGPSYTVDTLRLLHQEWGAQTELYFIIGGDSLHDLPGWYNAAGIVAQATIVALMRPGYTYTTREHQKLEASLPALKQRLIILEGPYMEISSTDLRQRITEGRPITYQVPEAVEQYIQQQRLYHGSSAGAIPVKSEEIQENIHATNAI
jgi:nicotinate-nucleotide adenylyltransferase